MSDQERDRIDALSAQINATNPNKLELYLSLQPGGPTTLEEAVARILRGEPVIQEEPGAPDEKQ